MDKNEVQAQSDTEKKRGRKPKTAADAQAMTVAERRAALDVRKIALEERKMALDERKMTLDERKMTLEEAKVGAADAESDKGVVLVGSSAQPETVVRVVFGDDAEKWAT